MKKITLADAKGEIIKFLVRGQRGSSTAVELVIDAKGVVAQDADAALAKERLGSSIIITDVDAKAAAQAVVEAVADATEPAPDEPEAAVATPAPTPRRRSASNTAK